MSSISLPKDFTGVRVHFVGIKGTGMTALVEILKKRGALITGSDVAERFYTDAVLEKLGIRAQAFSESNITGDIDYVIYSSAYDPEKNPDLIEARSRGISCLLYTEALGAVSAESYSAAVSGVHGKTSTTGIVGTIFEETDIPVQVLAGSAIASFGESCTMTSENYDIKKSRNYFVAETCEYRRHFMSFHPQKIILTSVESDHQDYYPTYEDIKNAFIDFICKLPSGGTLIYCADDRGAVEAAEAAYKKRGDIEMIPYGEKAQGDYRLTIGKTENEAQHFSIGFLGEASLYVPGKHEVLDACAASALVREIIKSDGKDPDLYRERIVRGLANFRGGKRRSEVVGKAFAGKNSVVFIDDYGHHPTAIKTTLKGFREFYGGRKIIVDFMSHTYTRTSALLEEFASAFSDADEVILHKIYASARESAEGGSVTGKTLFEKTKAHHGNVHYFEEVLDAKDFALSELAKPLSPDFPSGCLFVTMGAGDNWKLGTALFAACKDAAKK